MKTTKVEYLFTKVRVGFFYKLYQCFSCDTLTANPQGHAEWHEYGGMEMRSSLSPDFGILVTPRNTVSVYVDTSSEQP